MNSMDTYIIKFESNVFIEKQMLIPISLSEHDIVSCENIEYGTGEFPGGLLEMESEQRKKPLTLGDLSFEMVDNILTKLHSLELFSCYGVSTGIRRIVKRNLHLPNTLGIYLSDKMCIVFAEGKYVKYTKDARRCAYGYGTYETKYVNFMDLPSESNERVGFLEDVNYAEAGLNVFLAVLTTPEVHLKELRIHLKEDYKSSKFIATFKNTLISSKVQLDVTTLHLIDMNPKQIMRILPYLKPTTLKKIRIDSGYGDYDKENMRELTRTEHWKQAEKIEVCFPSLIPIKKLLHLREFSISRHKMTAREIANIKNHMFKHKNIDKVELLIYDEDFDVGIARRVLGPYIPNPDDPNTRYYQGANEAISVEMIEDYDDCCTCVVMTRMVE